MGKKKKPTSSDNGKKSAEGSGTNTERLGQSQQSQDDLNSDAGNGGQQLPRHCDWVEVIFLIIALLYLGLWAGCLISRWDPDVLVNSNSSDDRTSRVLGAVLLVGASCLFLTRMSKVRAETSRKF
jgi:hypothetical protein